MTQFFKSVESCSNINPIAHDVQLLFIPFPPC